MEEVWKQVPGHPEYEVSDLGRIRSWKPRSPTAGPPPFARVLRQAVTKGYLTVMVSEGGEAQRVYVHHLVLDAFVGPRPDDAEACHNDGDPTNNRLSNLRWDTRQANVLDKVAHGTEVFGRRNGNAALTPAQVRGIRVLRSEGVSMRSIGKAYGVSAATVHRIVHRELWPRVEAHGPVERREVHRGHGNQRVTSAMLDQMRALRASGRSYPEIARTVGVSTSTAHHALKGLTNYAEVSPGRD